MARPPKIPCEKMTTMKFGKLTPVKCIGIVNGRTTWECLCDCGNTVNVIQKHLSSGNTKSCGCIQRDSVSVARRTHGKSKSRLYILYRGIKERCKNPKSKIYKWYGAKGIGICKEWDEDFLKFEKWMLDNGYDESLPRGEQTIDRIDTNGDYCPDNCRLITISKQQRNKENNVFYEFNGEKHLLSEWSEILGIDYLILKSRVGDYGWTIKEALENPKFSKVKIDKKTISFNGETKTIKEWSEKLGIKENTIRGRMRYYSEPEKILNVGKNKRTKRGQ